ncbi:Uncharacterised protein [Mycobacteroides abscessus]|nr:Uncharacterised protein [Mycobacteroides abscessus]SLC81341.1 Uncharacterised protein [Mycobacteroides abscessus subsp. massiliense]
MGAQQRERAHLPKTDARYQFRDPLPQISRALSDLELRSRPARHPHQPKVPNGRSACFHLSFQVHYFVSAFDRSPRVRCAENAAANHYHSHAASVSHWSRPINDTRPNTT